MARGGYRPGAGRPLGVLNGQGKVEAQQRIAALTVNLT